MDLPEHQIGLFTKSYIFIPYFQLTPDSTSITPSLKDLPLEKSLSAVKECENKITSCSTSAPWRREPKCTNSTGMVRWRWGEGWWEIRTAFFNQNYQSLLRKSPWSHVEGHLGKIDVYRFVGWQSRKWHSVCELRVLSSKSTWWSKAWRPRFSTWRRILCP